MATVLLLLYRYILMNEKELDMDKRNIVGLSNLGFAVVEVDSNVVVSLYKNAGDAELSAANFNEDWATEDKDGPVFEAVELLDKVAYKRY